MAKNILIVWVKKLAGIVLVLLVIFSIQSLWPYKSIKNSKTAGISIESEAQKIAGICLSQNRACYKTEFTQLTKRQGLFFAEDTLYALQDIDKRLRHCHVLSHMISRVATRQDPSKWKELMDQVNINTCGAGFLHGIIEAHTGDDPEFKITSSFIQDTCLGDKTEPDFKTRTCSHILGHLILIDTLGEVEPALPICAALPPQLNLECYNGVFMEDSFKTSLSEHGLAAVPVRDEKRLIAQRQRCFNYTELPSTACWIDMAEIFSEFYNYDPVKTYESCGQAPEKIAQDRCFLKAVILMAVSPQYDNMEKMLAPCNLVKNREADFYEKCVYFMVSSLEHYSPKFTNRGVMLCSNIDPEYQEKCFQDMGSLLKLNVQSLAEREAFCLGTPEKFKNLCAGT